MSVIRSARRWLLSLVLGDSTTAYERFVSQIGQQGNPIKQLVIDDDVAIENDVNLGYDPNDSAIRKLRY